MRIFISYRRQDTPGHAGRLYDRLSEHFGADSIFMDIDAIDPGLNFVEVIDKAIRASDALVALIGQGWLNATDAQGLRRLDSREDWVRLEIASALEQDKLVIPALVKGARMPPAEELPEDLRSLSVRNAIEISDLRFHQDVNRLIESLDRLAVSDRDAESGSTRQLAQDLELEADLELEEQLEKLYTRGLGAFYTEDWAAAVRYFQDIVARRPEYEEAASKLAAARQKAEETRLYQAGHQAFEAGDWPQAIEALGELVELSPAYEDAEALLEVARKRKRVKDLYGEAQRLFKAEAWRAVLGISTQIAQLDPDFDDPEGIFPAAEREQAQAEREAELETLYAEAVRILDAGQLETAEDRLSQLLEMEPGFGNAEELLAKVKADRIAQARRREAEQLYAQAVERLDAGEVKAAQALLARLIEIDPGFHNARKMLDGIEAEAKEQAVPSVNEASRPGPEQPSVRLPWLRPWVYIAVVLLIGGILLVLGSDVLQISRGGTISEEPVPEEAVPAWAELGPGDELAVIEGHGGGVLSASFSPDGRRIVTASADDTARVWDAITGQELVVLEGHDDWVWSASFSPDGTKIVTASGDGTARVWDVENGQVLVVLTGHDGGLVSASFSPDGEQIVTASGDGTARVWDSGNGQVLAVLAGHEGGLESASFSPDGEQIVTASRDGSARVWNPIGESLFSLKGHSGEVLSASFSPDGRWIATSGADNTIRIWEDTDGQEVDVFRGHEHQVYEVAFSPSGRRIVSASEDRTARVWGRASGWLLAVIDGHGDWVGSAKFSPDGTKIVTASWDGTARVWDAR